MYSFHLPATGLFLLPALVAGQLERTPRPPAALQTWTGQVCLADGSAAAGAVVVTSAGGEAITSGDGSFELEVEIPAGAESVEVTAVAAPRAAGERLVARTRIAPSSSSPTTSIGRLVLLPTATLQPEWLPTFGGRPGTDSPINALIGFEGVGGPALYAGGGFQTAGGATVNRVACWNGSSWSAVGDGTNGMVSSFAVFDDGSGPALHAGGSFTSAGGNPANSIAKWDGTSWSKLGGGVSGSVLAMTVFDDGNGPVLYAGGAFTSAGGVAANRIARWDGSSWSPLGSGTNGIVLAFAVLDDGSAPALYAGGEFTSAGGVAASHIARWDGSSWSPLGSGLDSWARALAVLDDGTGPALYAGGSFTSAGGVAANGIAKWDGVNWTALGTGVDGSVRAIGVLDDGSGPALYAGGMFWQAGGVAANQIAKWDGMTWSALGSGITGARNFDETGPYALAVFDDGDGPALFAGGNFMEAGGRPGENVARWDATGWSALGEGLNDTVDAFAVFDDGEGPALYVGGTLTGVSGAAVGHIARWDGASWSGLGSGTDSEIEALAVFDDGGGPALYVGGFFPTAGGIVVNQIARWDGATWSRLGSGMGGVGATVWALAVFDDGGGPALYAGGSFTLAGGAAANRVARWNGTSWSPLGSGMNGGMNPGVGALAVFDDGGGPALYAGGWFTTAGGAPASGIARWNGASWSPLGSGVGGTLPIVSALAVFDDGGGPALHAGGSFTTAGGAPAKGIARWDGARWSPLGSGVGGLFTSVIALAVFDDGGGPALFAGGGFTLAGGMAANRIARWDGSSWSALGSGTDERVAALAVFDDGRGPALHVGGHFYVSPAGDSHLARWGTRGKVRLVGR